jgi:hypothetical protein
MGSLTAVVFFLGRIQYGEVVWRGIFPGVDSLYFGGRVEPFGPEFAAIEGITEGVSGEEEITKLM